MSVRLKGFILGFTVCGLSALVFYGVRSAPSEQVVLPIPSQYLEVPCWFEVAPNLVTRCGTLRVAGRKQAYHLPVVVIQRANRTITTATLKSTPLLYMGGGPGSGLGLGEEEINGWFGWYQQQQLTQPLVLMDYRSTGLAQPKFTCQPFYRDYVLSLTQPKKLHAEDLFNTSEQCFSIWRERGFDESDFTSAAFAEDYIALVKLMGYAKVDVYGVSFGTSVALQMAKQQANTINSMVLDSPVNINKSGPHYWPDRLSNALDGYFARCRESASCVIEESEFKSILEQLKEAPITLEITNWHEPGRRQVELGDQLFVSVFFNSLYSPQFLTRFSDLNTSGDIGEAVSGILESYINDAVDPRFSHFVYYVNRCMDNPDFDSDIYSSGYSASQWQDYIGFQPQLDVCRLIEKPHPLIIETPFKINLPVTILSGEIDPITPLLDAKELSAGLENGLLVVFSGVGHGVVNGEPCLRGYFSSLFDNPLASKQLSKHCNNASLD